MKFVRPIAILLCVLMTISVFAACNTGDNGGTTTADKTGTGEPAATTGTSTDSAETESESATTGDESTPVIVDTSTDKGETTSEPSTDKGGESTTDSTTAGDETTTTTTTPDTNEPIEATLTFSGMKCTPSVSGAVSVSEGAFLISRAGTYTLTGDLSNGQIRVAVAKTEEVTLIFNGFTASSSTTAPIYIMSADKVTIELAAGTVNTLEDAEVYVFSNPAETKPNACIYSSDDLTIKGDGTLIVTANYNNGIGGKNDVRIRGGNVTVTAPNNIIKGNDSVTITGATVKLSGGEDAIKTDNIDEQGKGYILIGEGAKVTIECTDDALQADQALTVDATAKISGTCGGDAINCPGVINVADGAVTVESTAASAA
ncbi:MAG: carbohydrate-binding domain-containing protein [Ruminococcaceae bacterium]|nr:carbohydrate-binding domain-containing protein [Oscillospiraceae bacterium]